MGPHTDRADKIISCVFYLDSPSGACGTTLLKPKDPDFVAGSRHYGYSDFDVIKTLKYRKNKIIAWEVVPDSFHAFYQREKVDRRTIKLFIQRSGDISSIRKMIEETRVHTSDWEKDVG